MPICERSLAHMFGHFAGSSRYSGHETLEEWWLKTRRGFHGKVKRGFDSLVIGALWAIWKQRNAHVFNRPEQVVGPRELAMAILSDIRDWSSARFGVGGLDRFVRS